MLLERIVVLVVNKHIIDHVRDIHNLLESALCTMYDVEGCYRAEWGLDLPTSLDDARRNLDLAHKNICAFLAGTFKKN